MPLFDRRQLEQGAWDKSNKAVSLLLAALDYIAVFHLHKGSSKLPKDIQTWLKDSNRQIVRRLMQIQEVNVIVPTSDRAKKQETAKQQETIYPIVSASLSKYLRVRQAGRLQEALRSIDVKIFDEGEEEQAKLLKRVSPPPMTEDDYLALSILFNGYDSKKEELSQADKEGLCKSIDSLIDDTDSFVTQHTKILRHLALTGLEPQEKGVLKDKYQEQQLQLLDVCFQTLALAASSHDIESFDKSAYLVDFYQWKSELTTELSNIYHASRQQLLGHDNNLSEEDFILQSFKELKRDNREGYKNLTSLQQQSSVNTAFLLKSLKTFITKYPKPIIETAYPTEIAVSLDKFKALMSESMRQLEEVREKTGDIKPLLTKKAGILDLMGELQRLEIDAQKERLDQQYQQAKRVIESCRSRLLLFMTSLEGDVESVTYQLAEIKQEATEAYAQLIKLETNEQQRQTLKTEKEELLKSIDASETKFKVQQDALSYTEEYSAQWRRIYEHLSAQDTDIEDLDKKSLSELLDIYSEVVDKQVVILKQQIEESQKTVASLSTELESSGLSISDLEGQMAALKREVKRLESSQQSTERLRRDLSQWGRVADVSYPSLEGVSGLGISALINLRDQMSAAEYRHIEEQLATTTLALSSLQESSHAQIERLQEKVRELKAKTEALEALQISQGSQDEKFQAQTSELEELRELQAQNIAQIEALKAELNALREELASREEALRQPSVQIPSADELAVKDEATVNMMATANANANMVDPEHAMPAQEVTSEQQSLQRLTAELKASISGWQKVERVDYPENEDIDTLTPEALFQLQQRMLQAEKAHFQTQADAQVESDEPAVARSNVLDLVQFIEQFNTTFERTNSKGIQRIRQKMAELSTSEEMDEGAKLTALRDYMAEVSSELEHRNLSRFSFWFMKGRTDGVQKLYTEMARAEFKAMDASAALTSIKNLIEKHAADYTFVHGR